MNNGAWTRLGPARRSTLWTGAILGIGLMGAVDTIIFHQLLQWHNFYSDADDFWRIFSDGLLHAFTAGMLFLGALRLWTHRRRISRVLTGRPLWAGFFLGAGAFQLFDGTVNHKVLRLHQIREEVDNILPYDIAWNAFALGLLVIGWVILRRASGDDAPAEREHVERTARVD
jgi:uncharacterized membrane protein